MLFRLIRLKKQKIKKIFFKSRKMADFRMGRKGREIIFLTD